MRDVVLVIGGTGFVGRRLMPALASAGFEVRIHSRHHGPLSSLGASDVSSVINLAGRTFVPDSWRDPAPFYRDNIQPAVDALAFCRDTGASLVHLSSYVYGVPRTLPIAEEHPLSASNPYAHSKILAESAVEFFREHFGVTAAVIRPFNLYGPGQDRRFVIPSIARQCLDRTSSTARIADTRPKRDYLHVDDLVRLIVLAARERSGGTYNAGSGHSTSVGELIRLMSRIAGVTKVWIETGEQRPNEIPDVIADVHRADRELGWVPVISLEDGLRDVLARTRAEEAES